MRVPNRAKLLAKKKDLECFNICFNILIRASRCASTCVWTLLCYAAFTWILFVYFNIMKGDLAKITGQVRRPL